MGGTIVSLLDFVVGITENRGAKSCDLKVHLWEKWTDKKEVIVLEWTNGKSTYKKLFIII